MNFEITVHTDDGSNFGFCDQEKIPELPLQGTLRMVDEYGSVFQFNASRIVAIEAEEIDNTPAPVPEPSPLAVPLGGFTPRKKPFTAGKLIFYALGTVGILGLLVSFWAAYR